MAMPQQLRPGDSDDVFNIEEGDDSKTLDDHTNTSKCRGCFLSGTLQQ
jgi:hypothetical protein